MTLTLSFHMTQLHWNDSVRWNDTLCDSKKMDPKIYLNHCNQQKTLLVVMTWKWKYHLHSWSWWTGQKELTCFSCESSCLIEMLYAAISLKKMLLLRSVTGMVFFSRPKKAIGFYPSIFLWLLGIWTQNVGASTELQQQQIPTSLLFWKKNPKNISALSET